MLSVLGVDIDGLTHWIDTLGTVSGVWCLVSSPFTSVSQRPWEEIELH